MKDIINNIKYNALFSKVTESELEELLKHLNYSIEKYDKGTVIAQEDDNCSAIGLVLEGRVNIEKIYPSAISIFIMPPTFEELERRIRERGTDSEDVIRQRLKIAKEEIKNSNKYDYVVINNTVDKSVSDITNIINKEREK